MSGRHSSSLLIDEQPLQVIPSLAEALGVNAAILLQQINYWIKHSEREGDERKFKRGRWWTYNSYADWQKQMPWLSESGVRKLVKKLRDANLIAVVKHKSQDQDHTLWYTINYEAVDSLRTLGHIDASESDTSNCPAGTSDASESDTSYIDTENPESLSETPPKPPRGGDRGKTIKAPSSAEYVVMFEEFVAADPLGLPLRELVTLSASENKTGRKRFSSAYTGFVEPLKAMRAAGLTDAALREGLDAAIKAGAPHMNYVKKVAAKYEPTKPTNLFGRESPEKGGEYYTDPDTGKVRKKKDYSHLFGASA